MAGKPTNMSKIKQVLQLHEQGHSNRQISRELSINKETVNNYVKTYKDDPEMDARFHSGNPAYTNRHVLSPKHPNKSSSQKTRV